MRQLNHPTSNARKGQRTWLKLVRTLLHLGVLFGGAFGLPHAVASAAATALHDAQARGELTLAREGVRVTLAQTAEKRGGPGPSPTQLPTLATSAGIAHLQDAAHARPIAFVPRLRSKHRAYAFQARAPPRTS